MAATRRWVLLVYRVPREPSTPRITIWRRLKRLGVAQLGDGTVALPASPRTTEDLEWVAQSVVEAGGTATVWTARPLMGRDEADVVAVMSAAVAEEYRAVVADAAAAAGLEPGARRRAVGRLRRRMREIGRRDHFPPPERDEATLAVDALAATSEVVAT